MATIQLSQVRPDFEDIKAQLQTALLSQDTWTDMLTTSTGQTIVDLMAAVGAYDQYSVESALQEAFPVTAKNDSSQYAAAQMLGIRLSRKLPALVTAMMSATSPVTLSAFTQFTGAGTYFYTRTAISLTSTPQEVTLYQGRVVVATTPGLGSAFQMFISQEKDFTVSDVDTYVWLNNDAVTKYTTSGLWEAKGKSGFQDLTLPDGSLAVLFGSTLYGTQPSPNDTVTIVYVVTNGLDGNNLETLDKKLVCVSDSTVTTTCLENPNGGGNQPSASLYKTVAAPLFGTFGSSVTPDQYRNLPMLYPGVKDCAMFSQRDMNPNALRWMNLIRVSVLPETPWVEANRDAFITWLQDRTMYACRFYLHDPYNHQTPIDIEVYCDQSVSLTQATADAEAAITELFSLKRGILDRDVYKSDIIDAVLTANSGIKYVIINAPTQDLIIARNVSAPPVVTFEGGIGGTLLAGTFEYAVSYVSAFGGETAPNKWRTVSNIIGGATAHISWDEIPNVVSYKLWGRQSASNPGLIATIAAGTGTYSDNGTIVPVAPIQEEDTTPVVYVTPSAVTVTADYATRRT